MDILPCKIESTGKKSASRAGLAAVAERLGHSEIEAVADDRMPAPGVRTLGNALGRQSRSDERSRGDQPPAVGRAAGLPRGGAGHRRDRGGVVQARREADLQEVSGPHADGRAHRRDRAGGGGADARGRRPRSARSSGGRWCGESGSATRPARSWTFSRRATARRSARGAGCIGRSPPIWTIWTTRRSCTSTMRAASARRTGSRSFAGTIRTRLHCIAGQIVRHARLIGA